MNKYVKHERKKMPSQKNLTVENHIVLFEHPLHWHSFFEIEIVLSGEGKYIINDVVHDISQKNVFLLTPTDFHYLEIEGEAELINISFDESMISEKDLAQLIFSDISRAYSFDKEEYVRIVNASNILRTECDIGGDCQKTLLRYIIKCFLRKNSFPASALAKEELFLGIKNAIIYIQLHFRENITLEQIAKEAGYTPTYFSRLFKRASGESFTEVLNKYRLGYAKTLLANGFSVSEACFLSGFGSLSNFSEVFRKGMKMSPSQYKSSLLSEGDSVLCR